MYEPKDTSFVMTEILGSESEMRRKSMEWLDMWLTFELNRGNKGCLIFDIDETVVEERNRRTFKVNTKRFMDERLDETQGVFKSFETK